LAAVVVAIQMVVIRYLAQSHQQVVVLVQILQVRLAVQAAAVVIQIQLVTIQAVLALRDKVLQAAVVAHHLDLLAAVAERPRLVLVEVQVQVAQVVLAVLRQSQVRQ
jgi:hypothetical protein